MKRSKIPSHCSHDENAVKEILNWALCSNATGHELASYEEAADAASMKHETTSTSAELRSPRGWRLFLRLLHQTRNFTCCSLLMKNPFAHRAGKNTHRIFHFAFINLRLF